MRASDLLGMRVVDGAGADLGPVRDLRVTWEKDVASPPVAVASRFEIAGVVVGGGRLARLAHAWGFTEGRATAPWIIRRLFAEAIAAARCVPAEQVRSWGPSAVVLGCRAGELRPLREELADDSR